MALNPRIILSGIQADVPGSFQRGLRFADEQRQFQERRELAPQRRQAAQQDIALGDLKIGAAERKQEFFEARRALALIQRADTPEKWDQIAAKAAPDLVGQFGRREELAATYQTILEALDPQTPDEAKVMNVGGALIQLTPDGQGGFSVETLREAAPKAAAKPSAFAEKVAAFMSVGKSREEAVMLASKGGVNISFGGESFDFGGDESGGPDPASVDGDGDVDPGLALGFGGAIRTAIFKTADFLNVGKFFPETAQAAENLTFLKTRFLFATRNMINQRMSNQMLDLVDKLTVSPGAIIGREGAMIRLQNGLELVEDNVAGLQRVADNKEGKFSKKAVSDAAQDGILLTNLLGEYKAVINSLAAAETDAAAGPGGGAEPTDESAEIDDLLRSLGVAP